MLKTTSGAAVGLAVNGLTNAKPDDLVRVNVGYSGKGGRKAALNAASAVRRDFSFDALSIEVPKRAVAALKRRPDVRYVEEDGQMHALADSVPWGVDRVDAEQAHADGYTGADADIAILDTGIDSNHSDLNNVGYSRGFGYSTWEDGNGHSTHCAGIAAAENDGQGIKGVASDATLHAGKVLSDSGSGSFSDIAAGVEWTANQGFDVASMSLGASSGSYTLQDGCNYANNSGVFVVVAAGNSGPCSDCVGYPAAYSSVMAVSSTNSSDDLSSFSSQRPEVEIAAPGSDIYSTYVDGTYTKLSGTSMACPHVAGAAGQLMANGSTNSEARSQLKSTAEDIGLSSNESGSGLLDVAAGSCSTCSSYPADYPEVASVGATNENNGVLSTSSTSVDIFAPGESIYSTVPAGYTTYSGTSMATPHVAAAAGILMAQRGYSNTNVLTRLRNTAQPVTNCSGCGLLDVRAAVNF
ncbi:S8 family serine peptidase [Haladaptatus halobius]|uniref:S8 family serine peptidase n=1 Tax=Haladaptatus halobius TaxID=2884875 RepID=UPI001D0BC1B2|nr:S8 family serine peptidase [Haladaptatus halobius]